MASLREFVRELRRRRVFRVAAAYAVVAWLAIEMASVIGPELLLPDWFTRFVIVLAALGWPVALVLAWAYDVTPGGIRTTPPGGSDAAAEGPTRPTRGRRAAVAAVVVAAVVAGGLVALRRAGGEGLPEGEALVERIAALADAGRYGESFELATAAGSSGRVVPDSLWPAISDRLTVETDPAGARVLARLFGDTAGWDTLGTTPLREIRLPRGDYLLRIEREGYAPVERLASTALQRSQPYLQVGQPFPGVAFRLRLAARDAAPADMVRVPGGRYTTVTPSLQNPSAPLEDFLVDRFEVSNAEFAAFVEAGGYIEPRYWTELREADGLIPGGTPAGLVDRTGLPGPRGWSGQTPPPGRERHPVVGVTWYEAAAYCRYRGRRLPSLFEWEKAARDGTRVIAGTAYMPWGPAGAGPEIAARANFGGTGTVRVDAHPFGISPYGAYAMAGNVKEWLSNPAGAGRAVTGGSWEDPVYLFSQVGAVAPAAASAALGFRCARLARPHPDAPDQGSGRLSLATEPPVYQPVGDGTFATLLSHYRYDPGPLDAVIEERREAGGWVRERIRFTTPRGDRAIAYLYLPRTARPPYQTLVFVPGADTYYGVGVDDATEWLLGPIIRSGRAVFSVVLPGMFGREPGSDYRAPEPSSVRFRDELVRDALEIRAGIDYLATRDELDLDRLAYVAVSRGAGSRLAFGAVDTRFHASVLIGAGIDERIRPVMPEVDNVNFAPRVNTPILVVNGREDEEHPWLTRGLPLWNLLPEPKELVLIDGAGHVPPAEQRVPPILEFLDRTFGPSAARD